MMRPLLFSILAVLGVAPALKADPYGMAGCGVGSLIFQDDRSVFMQSLASSTNWVSTQSFSITTGSSGCVATGRQIAELRQQEFLASNLSLVAKESARGGGDAVEALAETFLCDQASRSAFAEELRAHYAYIFGQPGTEAILTAARSRLVSNITLAKNCGYFLL